MKSASTVSGSLDFDAGDKETMRKTFGIVLGVVICTLSMNCFAEEKVNIDEGLYFLNVEADNHFVMNVSENGTNDGTNINIMQNQNLDCQKFRIENIDEQYCRIISLTAEKDLTITNGDPEKEANLEIDEYQNLDCQKWQFFLAGEGRYLIKSALGTYIDNYGGNLIDGNNVWMYENNGSATQMWMLTTAEANAISDPVVDDMTLSDHVERFSGEVGKPVEIKDGVYCINVEADNEYVMNVNGNYTKDGATIDIMPNMNVDCQKFMISRQKDGYYTITAMNSGKAISVSEETSAPETDLVQRTMDGSDCQKWKFIYVDEERVKIQSKLGSYIDNYGGQIVDANNVWMYSETESASQIWMLTKVLETNQNTAENEQGIEKQTGVFETEDEEKAVMNSETSASEAVLESEKTLESKAASEKYEIGIDEDLATQESLFVHVEDGGIPDGQYYIVPENDNTLRIGAAENENHPDNILLQEAGESEDQVFECRQLENGGMRICSVLTGKSIDVDGGSVMDGANVQMWEYDGTAGQIWEFEMIDEGHIVIKSKLGTFIGAQGTSADSNVFMTKESPLYVNILPVQ